MGKFRDKMQADLVLRGLSIHTQRSYLFRAREFVAHYRRPPTELGTSHVREFLLHIGSGSKLGASSHGVYVAALTPQGAPIRSAFGVRSHLEFLFGVTLGRPDVVAAIPSPRQPRTLPEILSLDEVARFFEHVHSMRQRALLMTAYAAGLRVSEACNLRIDDIDSSRMVIHVRGGTHQWGPIRCRLRRDIESPGRARSAPRCAPQAPRRRQARPHRPVRTTG